VGAGKTTLMRAIAGSLALFGGEILLEGEDVSGLHPHQRVRRGLALVPEGRRLFRGMTVRENLQAGAFATHDRRATRERLDEVVDLFPLLGERLQQQAGTLSGGEQQMCAIGRALMSQPKLLLVDELSLGLAPVVVDILLDALVRIRGEGTTLLVVEQDVQAALEYSDRAYLMRHGEIVSRGPSSELLVDTAFQRDFLGIM
jgi:branched-chain amino acid transport system ATP-binding protein